MRFTLAVIVALLLVDGSVAAEPAALAKSIAQGAFPTRDGFEPIGPILCAKGASNARFAIQCHLEVSDAERSSGIAMVDFLIYDQDADFSAEDALLLHAIEALDQEYELAYDPEITLQGPNGPVEMTANCHQALGETNSEAYCLMAVEPQVLVMTTVSPLTPSTEQIEVSLEAASKAEADADRAGDLAAISAVVVKVAL